MKKSQNETIYSILTEKDLKQIKLTRNDGKDTTCYLKFTNDLKDDHKKGIYVTTVITSAGRKMGLEIYQTTHGGGDAVHLILKPVDDRLEITVGCDQIDMLTTEIPIWYETSDNKLRLIELIKSMIKYSTDYNPTYIK